MEKKLKQKYYKQPLIESKTENRMARTRPKSEFEWTQLGISWEAESEDKREGLLEVLEEFILWIVSIDKESWNPLGNVMVIIHNCGWKWKKVLVTQSCPTLCNPMDWNPPDSSVHGILQARILDWVAVSFSRWSSQPRDWTCVSTLQADSLRAEPPRTK